MVDDQQDEPGRGREPEQNGSRAADGRRPAEDHRRDQNPGIRDPDLDPENEEMMEDLREFYKEHQEEESRARLFSRHQLVHEASVEARNIYGERRYVVDPASPRFGERSDDAGYYNLVDAWEVTAFILKYRYHERFLKRAQVLNPESRINRRLIPNYFVIALDGVQRSINREYIAPILEDKLKWAIYVRFPGVLPPLAWWDWAPGLSRDEAKKHAKLMEHEHPAQEDKYQFLVQREKELIRDLKRFTAQAKDAAERLTKARNPPKAPAEQIEAVKEEYNYYGRRATDVKQQLEDVRKRLDDLKQVT